MIGRSVLNWIDAGYDDGIARSNLTMGLAISVLGLIALASDSPLVRTAAIALAVATFLLFGWRMILSFGRIAAKADRRKTNG